MIALPLLTLVAFTGLAAAVPDAPLSQNNPLGATYMATLPNSSFTTIRGTISGSTNTNGTGVDFTVSFDSIPATGGPYIYHIHADPVPADGNCTGAGPHLDPENRGEKPPCDPSTPQQCQVGDLAGKHGSFNASAFTAQSVPPLSLPVPVPIPYPNSTTPPSSSSSPFSPSPSLPSFSYSGLRTFISYPSSNSSSGPTNTLLLRYLDPFVSSSPGSPAYFGNRSVVIHDASGTRLTCANFSMLSAGQGPNPTTISSAAPSGGSTTTMTGVVSVATGTVTSVGTTTVTGSPSPSSASGASGAGAGAGSGSGSGSGSGASATKTGAATGTGAQGPVQTFTGVAARNVGLSVGAGVLALGAFLL
ncbi:hypothetical protein MMC10_010935 [Thelotrema lepadinum]|nr:hypothetical protein [Thelotrema lepadinum]